MFWSFLDAKNVIIVDSYLHLVNSYIKVL